MSVVGRAAKTPVASGAAGARPATRGGAGGLHGRALGGLAGDGDVGRDRVAVAPGAIPFGEKGTGVDVRASNLPVGTVCVRGAAGGVRLSSLRIDVHAWLAARKVVVKAVSERRSAGLDQVASISSSLLRKCQGSVDLFLSTIGSSSFSPHTIVQHEFGTVKNFPCISLLLRVLAPGAPVSVARGGDFTTDLAYGNHSVVAMRAVAIHQNRCADVVHGRAFVFDLRFAAEIEGLRISPLSVVLEPKLIIIHDLSFARETGRTSDNSDTDFDPAPPCKLGRVHRGVLSRVLICNRRTVVALESSCAAWTSKMPFGRFWFIR